MASGQNSSALKIAGAATNRKKGQALGGPSKLRNRLCVSLHIRRFTSRIDLICGFVTPSQSYTHLASSTISAPIAPQPLNPSNVTLGFQLYKLHETGPIRFCLSGTALTVTPHRFAYK